MAIVASNIVVFGDSLSDIGQKWKTPTGRLGIKLKQMFVNPNGRYSDCRNWTDHMIEAASPVTLLKKTPEATIKRSARHHGLTEGGSTIRGSRPFQYANYAMGAAVGSGKHFNKLSSQVAFTSFKHQVDLFEQDVKQLRQDPGDTLFVIWFGANDLYTDERLSHTMTDTAKSVVKHQARLRQIMKARNSRCHFIIVGLLGPMTIVRYVKQLEQAMNAAIKTSGIDVNRVLSTSDWLTSDLNNAKKIQKALQGSRKTKSAIALDAVIADIDRCEAGARLYNEALRQSAEAQGDEFADIDRHFNETVIKHFVNRHPGTLAVDAQKTLAGHVDRDAYIKASSGAVPIATIDELHPTDPVYAQMWEVIYDAMARSEWTFGDLAGGYHNNMLGDIARDLQPRH